MVLTSLLVLVALLQYFYFGIEVGRARGRFGVDAPATTGHPEFERYVRVHMNTLEQVVILVPAAFVFAHFGNDTVAGGAVALFIVGRFIYFRSYVADPAKRGLGFVLTILPSLFLVLGSIVVIARTLLAI